MQNEEGAESLEYVAIGVVSYSPGISGLVSTAFSAMTNVISAMTGAVTGAI